jgi:hypothetical protein
VAAKLRYDGGGVGVGCDQKKEELMGYAAIGLAILGFAIGVTFRFKVLLTFVGLLLIFSVAASLDRGFTFLETALTVMVAQSILQGMYFLGLVAKSVLERTNVSNPPTSDPPQ